MSHAICVENLGKRYRIAKNRSSGGYQRFSDTLASWVKAPFRASHKKNASAEDDRTTEDFWALRDVSFNVKEGEILGVIGRNGAGKSTLLKILARITEPTIGKIKLRGRVASLLEVGTGFHPELTGRENIFLNGAILGMSRTEIASRFDEIVAFAEVEKFLSTPVKRYSSGMYVRLAFAVAAHLEPEILVVDEVLAVGDALFQQKCMGKMTDVARNSGRTVLFVSHNLTAIRQLTKRCIVLEKGNLLKDGTTDEAVKSYLQESSLVGSQGYDTSLQLRRHDCKGTARILNLRFKDNKNVFQWGEEMHFTIQLDTLEDTSRARVSFVIFTNEGQAVAGAFSAAKLNLVSGDKNQISVCLKSLLLAPGRYYFDIAIGHGGEASSYANLDVVTSVLSFEMANGDTSDLPFGRWDSNWGSLRMLAPEITISQ
jgi:lipopolysaccharide transport system ATP-binding protein